MREEERSRTGAGTAMTRREPELNEQPQRREARELAEFLVSASNALFLHERLCQEEGLPVPASIQRAHAAIRAELKRLEARGSS